MMRLHDLMVTSTDSAVRTQNSDGSFLLGHNGPYHDPETPVRNTAHILFLLASQFEKTNNETVKISANKAIDYLLSLNARPYAKTFYCRDKTGKDRCNGLIGQAWVMEALIKAANAFNREDCYSLAEEVFLMHPWDKDIEIWKRVEIDGQILPYDETFNHQLWFAAVASQLNRTPVAQERALAFLTKVNSCVSLYPNGVIFHSSPLGTMNSYLSLGLLKFIRQVKWRLKAYQKRKLLYSKSVGYQGFNLYALALLKQQFPNHLFWSSLTMKKMLVVTMDNTFLEDLDQTQFGWTYNPLGLELAFVGEIFNLGHAYCQAWINRQFEKTFDSDTQNIMTLNSPDKATSSARLYEAARLIGRYVLPKSI